MLVYLLHPGPVTGYTQYIQFILTDQLHTAAGLAGRQGCVDP